MPYFMMFLWLLIYPCFFGKRNKNSLLDGHSVLNQAIFIQIQRRHWKHLSCHYFSFTALSEFESSAKREITKQETRITVYGGSGAVYEICFPVSGQSQ